MDSPGTTRTLSPPSPRRRAAAASASCASAAAQAARLRRNSFAAPAARTRTRPPSRRARCGGQSAARSTKRWSRFSQRPIPTPRKTWWRLPRTALLWCSICCCAALSTLGARLAEPGEFTQRAFLSGRIDLTQAEAVRDLIDAQTLTQARQAASQTGRRAQPSCRARQAGLSLS